ncbi:MAG: hypothetical protein D9V47_02990 [Clostridia bacterium]|nr:MAG: hypothetical protein D9V47_02990 [Clostridia bacterium]
MTPEAHIGVASLYRALAAFALAFLATRLFLPLHVAGLRARGLIRPNYRGQEVAWPGGLFLVVTASVVFLVTAANGRAGVVLSPGPRVAALIVTVVVLAGLGLIDDFFGGTEAKGLRGHLGLLLAGQVSTGIVKAGGGLLAALAFALVAVDGAAVLVATLLVALMANAFNLLDLRPGRAAKAFLAGGFPLAALGGPAGSVLAPALGAVLAYLPHDLRCRVMLGDTGANALGAALGAAAVLALSPAVQVLLLAGLVLLHWYAERASLNEFIARRPLLRFLDELGRVNP